MTDIVDRQTRSKMMSGIRGKNTKPEMHVRKWLHSKGFRYRLHHKTLPGKPDLILRKWGTVIFVHGCFFHHHEFCKLAYVPKTHTDWWMEKFQKNRERDNRNIEDLKTLGWNVLVIWECQIRDRSYKTILQDYFRKHSSE